MRWFIRGLALVALAMVMMSGEPPAHAAIYKIQPEPCVTGLCYGVICGPGCIHSVCLMARFPFCGGTG